VHDCEKERQTDDNDVQTDHATVKCFAMSIASPPKIYHWKYYSK